MKGIGLPKSLRRRDLPLTAQRAVSELLFFKLLIKEQKVEECDARDDDRSTEARNTIIQLSIIKELSNKK